MATGSLLDTNIIIDFLNGHADIQKKIKTLDDIFIPITVVGELLYGAENSQRKQENRLVYEAFCFSFPIINTTLPVAREYGRIAAELKQKGKPIPMNDMWIAATAIANDLELVTQDNHFKEINGLKLHLVEN